MTDWANRERYWRNRDRERAAVWLDLAKRATVVKVKLMAMRNYHRSMASAKGERYEAA